MEREEKVIFTIHKLAGRFFLPVLFFLFFTPALFGQVNKILLTEKPWELEIYNNYKEKLPLNEKQKILPYTPFQFSDFDFSQPLISLRKIVISDKTFYLGVTPKKKISNISKAGKSILLKNYSHLSPETSLQLKRNKSFFYPDKKKVILKKGEKIKLLFRKGNRYLALRLAKPSYGFIYLSKSEIEKSELKKEVKKISEVLKTKIISEADEYNRKINSIVVQLDSTYSKNLSAPKWILVKSSDYMLDFHFTNGNVNDFSKSIAKLKSKIEIYLIGEKYKVQLKNNHLIVKGDGE
jgi:hypothetical protein